MMVVLNPGAIRAARNGAGLTLRAAAAILGVSKTTLVNTETGASEPGGVLLGRMAQVYGVDVDSFFAHPADGEAPCTCAHPPSGGEAPAHDDTEVQS